MGTGTEIEWTWTQLPDGTWVKGHTFNPWVRCTRVSPACDFCYAEIWAGRATHPRDAAGAELPVWGPDAPRNATARHNWQRVLAWQAEAAAAGVMSKVFCASLADVFETHPAIDVPIKAPMPALDKTGKILKSVREWLWDLIEITPNLLWLLLTKRPENIMTMVPMSWREGFPSNVWMGTTVENQKFADERLPHLMAVPAVLFASVEPLLAELDMRGYLEPAIFMRAASRLRRGFYPLQGFAWSNRLSWVIVGGESGGADKVRAFELAWARLLMGQCKENDVAFFFKQAGAVPVFSDADMKEIRPRPRRLLLTGGTTVHLRDSHGGDLLEIPADLRVRQTPYLPKPAPAQRLLTM